MLVSGIPLIVIEPKRPYIKSVNWLKTSFVRIGHEKKNEMCESLLRAPSRMPPKSGRERAQLKRNTLRSLIDGQSRRQSIGVPKHGGSRLVYQSCNRFLPLKLQNDAEGALT